MKVLSQDAAIHQQLMDGSDPSRRMPGGLRICIIGQNSYPALLGSDIKLRAIGGVQHQTALTARWLADRGYAASMITWDEGQSEDNSISGVRVFKMCKCDAGVPGLRFLYPRMASLFGAMKRAGADVYYHNTAEHETGLVALWCRLHGRKFVYSVAHDNGCDRDLSGLKKRYERYLYRFGLRNAHRILVQTEYQQQLLTENHGVSSVVIPMPCPGPTSNYKVPAPPERPLFAWVGRSAPIKRMEWLFEIAKVVPEVNFAIAAANPDTAYGRKLQNHACELQNVSWLGPVRRENMAALYESATGLCCTSVSEGFPNTFLEAWSHGRPLVTSFDPDNLVARKRLGFRCNTVEEFAAALRVLVTEREVWEKMSVNCRNYFTENHAIEVSMGRFERELLSVL